MVWEKKVGRYFFFFFGGGGVFFSKKICVSSMSYGDWELERQKEKNM